MSTSTAQLTSQPADPGRPPSLGPRELLRWAWRQLTSMRTALLLLLLLALAAVPGSVVPQSDVEALKVARFKDQHPDLAPIYDRLGLFSVYDSPWFSAIYLLLMVSLVGCILPRTAVYWKALRARPPQAPRNLARLPAYASASTAAPSHVVLERARTALRHYRVEEGDGSLSGERGYLREAGNLVFHVSVVAVLLAFAGGQLFGYKGGALILVDKGFSNSLTQYDDFAPGSLFDATSLPPVSLTVEDFEAEFLTSGPQKGQPTDFAADITYTESPGAAPKEFELKVNKPLVLDGVSVFLVGHGYAPILTIRDGNGDVASSGPVPFLPQDASFASYGVVKVANARPEQLAFEGLFLPTYDFDMQRGPYSAFPDAWNPAVSLLAYRGDLGMDDGTPQSVYELDTDELEKLTKADGTDVRVDLSPGRTTKLPDGLGSVTFEGWQRWVKLQVSHTPYKGVALAAVVVGLVGLMGSLFIRRRRAWVRVESRDGQTYVEVAGLDRAGGADEGLADEVQRVMAVLVPDTGPDDPGEKEER